MLHNYNNTWRFFKCKRNFRIEFLEAEVQMVPTTYVALDEKAQERMDKLLENLDELDDVMNVYHNSENN